ERAGAGPGRRPGGPAPPAAASPADRVAPAARAAVLLVAGGAASWVLIGFPSVRPPSRGRSREPAPGGNGNPRPAGTGTRARRESVAAGATMDGCPPSPTWLAAIPT